MTFTTKFKPYACSGDSITCEVDGFTVTARIEYDNDSGPPDKHDEGFWPSQDKNAPGYMGEVSTRKFNAAHKKASKIMAAWRNDEWFFVGVVLSVEKNGVMLADHAASLWGVECNYPGANNSYLLQVANELLDEALEHGKGILNKLVA